MTIDEVIEDIVENGIELGAGDYVDLDSLKEAVRYLKKYREMQWISLKDRLPEKETSDWSIDVLLTDGNRVELGYYDYDFESWETGDNLYDFNPTYWMPLPEPPEKY